jgi:hypothetical protein
MRTYLLIFLFTLITITTVMAQDMLYPPKIGLDDPTGKRSVMTTQLYSNPYRIAPFPRYNGVYRAAPFVLGLGALAVGNKNTELTFGLGATAMFLYVFQVATKESPYDRAKRLGSYSNK